MNCRIIHDSIHYRPGSTLEYSLDFDGTPAGYLSAGITRSRFAESSPTRSAIFRICPSVAFTNWKPVFGSANEYAPFVGCRRRTDTAHSAMRAVGLPQLCLWFQGSVVSLPCRWTEVENRVPTKPYLDGISDNASSSCAIEVTCFRYTRVQRESAHGLFRCTGQCTFLLTVLLTFLPLRSPKSLKHKHQTGGEGRNRTDA